MYKNLIYFILLYSTWGLRLLIAMKILDYKINFLREYEYEFLMEMFKTINSKVLFII